MVLGVFSSVDVVACAELWCVEALALFDEGAFSLV